MTERVVVTFEVRDDMNFQEALQKAFEHDDNIVGMATGKELQYRSSLRQFADEMEKKLLKNDHKTHWRDLPIGALFDYLMIELEEYKVAHKYLPVRDARTELVDVANYALILWDRLSIEKQNEKVT